MTRAAALEAIDGITATQLPGDLTDAFALSSALAPRDADSTVVVVTDAAGDELPDVGVGAPVLVERIGTTDANQAIAALSALRRAGGAQLDLFVAVVNPSTVEATRRLEVYADGELVDARDLTIPAGQRSEALDQHRAGRRHVVEARLAGADALLTDDRAFAVVPADETTRTLLVGAGNAYLENALALLPRLELYAVDADGYADARCRRGGGGHAVRPLHLRRRRAGRAARACRPSTSTRTRTGPSARSRAASTVPAIDRTDPDEPLLRFVDLSTRAHRSSARDLAGDGMRAVVETPRGDPLVAVGEVGGHARRRSSASTSVSRDLPLQVAFPLLMSNLTEVLLPAVEGILPSSMRARRADQRRGRSPRSSVCAVESAGAPDRPGTTQRGLELAVVGGTADDPRRRSSSGCARSAR